MGEKRLRPGAKPRNKNKKQTTPEQEMKEEEEEQKEAGEEPKSEDAANIEATAAEAKEEVK